jgi:F-type H+-transporting ATPase subunit epsilon
MPIEVEVVTQERVIFREPEADIVVIPAAEGEMGVLPHHAPTLTALGFGELVIRKGKAEERFAIYGGVVDVRPDKVVVLADTAASSYELDEAAAEAARVNAQRLKEQAKDQEEQYAAAAELRRAELTIQINRKVKMRGQSLRIIEPKEDQ